MTKAIKNLSSTNNSNATILKFILGGIFLAVVLYVYFLGTTVSKAMEGEKMLKKISDIEHQKVELEKKYMSIINKFDVDFAKANGFVEQPKEIIYASKQEFFAKR